MAREGETSVGDDEDEDFEFDLESSLHEVLDRVYVMSCGFETHIVEHFILDRYPELRAQAKQIGEQLGDLYQAIGNAMPDPSESS